MPKLTDEERKKIQRMTEEQKLRLHIAGTPHEHMLLWNLRAVRNNAIYSPWADQRAKAAKQVPMYEDELRKRGYSVPAIITDDDLNACLDRMIARGECRPREDGE